MLPEIAGEVQPRRIRNPFYGIARRQNDRARAKGAPGQLTTTELMRLWRAQSKRCVLTGVRLKIGITASLDHVQALSVGGANVITNCAFVHIDLNTWKSNLPLEDFCQCVGLDPEAVRQRIAAAHMRLAHMQNAAHS